MKVKVYGVVLVLVVSVAAGLGVMLFMDKQIDQALIKFEQSPSESVSVTVLEDANTFASRQLSHIVRVDNGGTSVSFVVNSDVKKRPWGATVEHELLLDSDFVDTVRDEELQALLRTHFVDKPILFGDSQIGITGRFGSVFNSSEVSEAINQGSIEIAPVLITAQGSVRTKQVNLTGNWKGMTAEITDGELTKFEIKPTTISAYGMYMTPSVFLGEQSMRTDGISFVVSDANRSEGNVSFKMDEFSATSSSDVADSRIESSFFVETDQVSFTNNSESIELNDFKLSSVLSGIEMNNLTNLINAAGQLQVAELMGVAVVNEANTLLQNGFAFEISELSGRVNDESFTLDARFELPENELADVGNPFSFFGLITQISANANMKLDADLMDVPQLSNAISTVVSSGAVVEDGSDYVMTFTMVNGIPTLNGNALQLPF